MIPFDELHPLVVHFPIAFFGLVFLFDVLSIYLKDDRFSFASFWTLIFALVSSLGTIVTGFVADQYEGHMETPWNVFSTHGSMQILSILLFIIAFVWRFRLHGTLPQNPMHRWVYIAITGLAVAGVYYGSHLGAMLAGRI